MYSSFFLGIVWSIFFHMFHSILFPCTLYELKTFLILHINFYKVLCQLNKLGTSTILVHFFCFFKRGGLRVIAQWERKALAGKPEFNSLDPPGRRELTLESCPLIFTSMQWHTICSHNKCNEKFKEDPVLSELTLKFWL